MDIHSIAAYALAAPVTTRGLLAVEGTGSSPSGSQSITFESPIESKTIPELLDNAIIPFLTTVSLSVAVIMVLYGAYQMLTSGGDPAGYKKGVNTIKYAAIGIAIIVLARGLVAVLRGALGEVIQ